MTDVLNPPVSCCVCCAVSESHLLPVVNGGSHLKVITRIFCEGPLMKKAWLFLKAQKKKKKKKTALGKC